MGFAAVLNPHSTSNLLTWFIGKVEMGGRIEAEATLSREERESDGRNGGLGIRRSIRRLEIGVIICVMLTLKVLSGRR